MKTAQRIGLLTALLLCPLPGGAAELAIPPLNPPATKASLPGTRQPARLPDMVMPRAQEQPRLIPDISRENRPPLVPLQPEGSIIDPRSGEPAASPTWLERFGPFLRSQLDTLTTGSITPRGSPCAAGTKASRHPGAKPCPKPPQAAAPREHVVRHVPGGPPSKN